MIIYKGKRVYCKYVSINNRFKFEFEKYKRLLNIRYSLQLPKYYVVDQLRIKKIRQNLPNDIKYNKLYSHNNIIYYLDNNNKIHISNYLNSERFQIPNGILTKQDNSNYETYEFVKYNDYLLS